MRHLLDRFTGPTPAFWRRIQKIAAGGLALVVALQTGGATEPAWLVAALPTAFTVLTTLVTVAQFTCSDSPADKTPA